MVNTQRLYLPNIEFAYETSFHAQVTEVHEQTVALDRTLFYPLGGGQAWDTGALNGPNGDLRVTEVNGKDTILHAVGENHQLEVGDEVSGIIDWQRRYSHMRMHTAQHLVSGVVYEMFDGARTVGNQINSHQSRIDFNPISFDEEMLHLLTLRVNSLIDEAHPLFDEEMSKQQVNAIMPEERTNMSLLPSSVKTLRVVTIGEMLDLCPCAGTHVSNLNELGHISIIGKKSKGKGTQRLTYELGTPNSIRSPRTRQI